MREWIQATPETLAGLRERWTGQRGGSEPETHIGRRPGDETVMVSSNVGADICNLVDKRPEVIRRFREEPSMVMLDCDPSMWSSPAGCFKSAGRLEAARERVAAGWKPTFGRRADSGPTMTGENGRSGHPGTEALACSNDDLGGEG